MINSTIRRPKYIFYENCSFDYNAADAVSMATVLVIRCMDNQNDNTGCRPATKNKKYNFLLRPTVCSNCCDWDACPYASYVTLAFGGAASVSTFAFKVRSYK